MSPNVIPSYAPLALIAIVVFAGILVAVVRWPQHPGVSMAALFGCLLLLVAIVGLKPPLPGRAANAPVE